MCDSIALVGVTNKGIAMLPVSAILQNADGYLVTTRKSSIRGDTITHRGAAA